METRTIRITNKAHRALKDHFSAKWQIYVLWDTYGYEPESPTIRDAVKRWEQRGKQAFAVLRKELGVRVASGVAFAYDRKVFIKQYGDWRRVNIPREKRLANMDPELRTMFVQAEALKTEAEELTKKWATAAGAACDHKPEEAA